MMSDSLEERLTKSSQPIILDGPMGTELSRRGFDVDREGWSARALVDAPDLVSAIHRDFAAAGAELHTTNTFRTHRANLAEWGQERRARELTGRAVELARAAIGPERLLCGSISPLGDSYRARSGADPDAELEWLRSEHQLMLDHLREAGVDCLLIETQTTWRELTTIVELARATSLPLLVSLVTFDGSRMLDGTPIERLADLAHTSGLAAIGANCLPAEVVGPLLDCWQSAPCPRMIYANSGVMEPSGEWRETAGANPEQHLELARDWVQKGVRILGGCCGTSCELIAKFSDEFSPEAGRSKLD